MSARIAYVFKNKQITEFSIVLESIAFQVLVPAYGRDYRSRAALLKDWVNGKDFACAWSGQYCSCRDFQEDKQFRYDKSQKTTYLKYRQATKTWY